MSDHYTYRVTWSAEDGGHVGLCLEFRSLSWLAPTPDEAFSGIRALVQDVVADLRANSEPRRRHWPSGPTADSSSCACHQRLIAQLVVRAAESGVSLNRLVSSLLTD